MINWSKTAELHNKTEKQIKVYFKKYPNSHKKIVVVCDECGKVREITKQGYHDLCHKCGNKNRPSDQLPIPKLISEQNRFIFGTSIDRILTIKKFGYDPVDLSKGSKRLVIAICKNCRKGREINFYQYRDLCKLCKMTPEETKQKLRISSTGKSPSEETRQKMRDSSRHLSGKDHPMYGQISPMAGKHHSNETIEKLSIGRMGKYCGEDSPRWNPNLTDEEREKNKSRTQTWEYRKWRKDVFKRDNFTCQICNQRGGNLNVHHIESYANNPDLRTTLSNGITLCEDCHKDFHRQFGYNCNKEQFIEFKNIL